jgi:hypothetical protein
MRLVALEKEEVVRLLEVAKRHRPRAHAMVTLCDPRTEREWRGDGTRKESLTWQSGGSLHA